MSEEVARVYRTTDYGMFKRLEGNRAVDHSDKVAVSIKNVGYVRSPILVNEKYEVIDGQNRLMALEKLGLPVEYIIQSGIGLKECQALNIGQKNWAPVDWVNSYAEQGKEQYIQLKEAKEKHKALSYRLLATIASKRPLGGDFEKSIAEGTLEYHSPTYAEEDLLCFLDNIKPVVSASGFRTDHALLMLAVLSARGFIDCSRMEKQFKRYSQNEKFRGQNTRAVLEGLQDLYNYNMRKCVYFADKYREMSRKRI